jgi:serine/threonine protein kinase
MAQQFPRLDEGLQRWHRRRTIRRPHYSRGSGSPFVSTSLQRHSSRSQRYEIILHSRSRLLKPIIAANVLLTATGRILLCDFGVSARLIHNHSKRTTFVGTPYWMAPEVIQQSQYDTKADIWSLGITLYEMVTGAPPHAKEDQMRALLLIPRADAPRLPETTGTKDMRDFVASVLREQPADVR